MSAQIKRGPTLRGYNRRKTNLSLDLNHVPPSDNDVQEGSSSQMGHQEAQGSQRQLGIPYAVSVVEAPEDDVVELPASAFAEAVTISRRNIRRTVVDVDAEYQSKSGLNKRSKRKRVPPSQIVINCDSYVNLEGSNNSNSKKQNDIQSAPPVVKDPVFSCPICMGTFVEEMSTKCGHIFCKECINASIKKQNKCPVCRKKITTGELIRVFLPAMS